MKLRLALALSCLSLTAFAQTVEQFAVFRGVGGAESQHVMSTPGYINKAILNPAASISVTCPATATMIGFFQPSPTNASVLVKPNGSGIPPAAETITDGTAWIPLPTGLAYSRINGAGITHWALSTDTSPTRLRYFCGKGL